MTLATEPVVMDPYSLPLDQIDVSLPALHHQDVIGAYFKRLRKEDPVHYFESKTYGPFWSITKFNDIVHVDSSHHLFSANQILIDDMNVQGGPSGDTAIVSFIAMDPPKHDEQRKSVTPAVAPANLAKLESTIRERARRVLDNLPINQEFDWVQSVSIELTSLMLCTLVDAPVEDRQKLIRWSDFASGVPGDGIVSSWEEKSRVLGECGAYFRRLYDERAKLPPRPDLISMLAHSPATQNMSPVEFQANIMLLIVGGNDTTRNSMSGSVLALNRYPEQWEKLKANPALVNSMVPEIIRWQTPIAYIGRRALVDTDVGGKTIRKGDKVAMWYLSGNRDDEVICQPEEFIIDRERPRHHLSFGFGIHRCLGNRLAELQLRVLWEEILKKNFKRIELTGEPKRHYSNLFHGILSMPVRIHV